MELRTETQTWVTALLVGDAYGCRPPFDVLATARSLKTRDGVYDHDPGWVEYLWPTILQIDLEYARCLSGALARGLEELDGRTEAASRVLDSTSNVFFSMARQPARLEALGAIAMWCDEGAFRVEFLNAHARLYRPTDP